VMTSVFQVQQGTPVVLIGNRTDERIETNATLPCLVQTEFPSSIQILVDSKDKVLSDDTPFDFSVNLTSNLYRGRSIQAIKCVIPKVPNVTVFNNQLQIVHDLGTTAVFSLQPAFYNTTTLANELTAEINLAFAVAGIVDTVVTSFDQITRTFSISSTGGNNFFITDDSTFITRGIFLANFESEPFANVPSKSIIFSGPAAMLYTRYLTVHSNTINYYALSQSVTSSFSQQSNIICTIDVSNIYDTYDYDPTKPYAGIIKSLDLEGSPQINIANGQKNLHPVHSFFVLDEWGQSVDDLMNLGGSYPDNKIGISLYFRVRF
jgi:hypothetical protein